MSTFTCTYDEFRKAASEFFVKTQDRNSITIEEAENGEKALGLMYLGMTDFDDLTEHQVNSCVMILELATKRTCEVSAQNHQ